VIIEEPAIQMLVTQRSLHFGKIHKAPWRAIVLLLIARKKAYSQEGSTPFYGMH
jgi:hypothetical protein